MKKSVPSFRYPAENLLQVAMPLGGIGAGTVCLNGFGGIQDFSIRHRPNITALPDGHEISDSAFALLHVKGSQSVSRLVEGPLPPEKLYDQGLQAQGYRHGEYHGLPRFRDASFEAQYPFGTVHLRDPKVPLTVAVTGFNPFIPLDDKNSGLPCAILEYAFTNTSKKKVAFEFSYHLSHPAVGKKGGVEDSRTKSIGRRGVHFFNGEEPAAETYGSACLMALAGDVRVKGMWFRGGWFDAVSALWREVSTGTFTENPGYNGIDVEWRNGGSILFEGTLKPGQSVTFPVVIAWHFPNSYLTAGAIEDKNCCGEKSECTTPAWRPYYAGVWKDALAVAEYVRENYESLRSRTLAFKDALFSSTLPREVIDAVSANLAILKSPTVLRQENGNLWGWEGCFTHAGCCHGSCTHVWNYAQAFPHLFPNLERTLREQELFRSMDEKGYINFRAALPDGPPAKWGVEHAAADGQLGGMLKLFRDWQISGDTEWLRSLYPAARQSLEYCIRTWDPERRGALFEPHHNTYDIEFWGADGMCTSIYIGALSAMSLMAKALGETEDSQNYSQLAERGARWMEESLFNGEYYQQKIEYKTLRDQSFVETVKELKKKGTEGGRLLEKEGPKYQYGSGCLSDGVIGAWMALLYGVETPLNRKQVVSSLKSIYRYNFRRDLSEHANTQRPGYATGREPGLLLCSWPRGDKPILPFIYSDEVWTGIEYQVASHLISEGLVEKGLEIVKALRSRFNGRVRNPFNEYECGSYYARAMASYSLLQAFSGFRYSAVEKTLWLAPVEKEEKTFRVFFSAVSGFGTLSLSDRWLTIDVIEGSLEVQHLVLGRGKKVREIVANLSAQAGHPAHLDLTK